MLQLCFVSFVLMIYSLNEADSSTVYNSQSFTTPTPPQQIVTVSPITNFNTIFVTNPLPTTPTKNSLTTPSAAPPINTPTNPNTVSYSATVFNTASIAAIISTTTISISTSTSVSATTNPVPETTHVLLVFGSGGTVYLNQSDFQNAFKSLSIPADNLAFNSSAFVNTNIKKRQAVDIKNTTTVIVATFDLKTQNTTYWKSQLNTIQPITVFNNKNENVSTAGFNSSRLVWNDNVCGDTKCGAGSACRVDNTAGTYSLKCYSDMAKAYTNDAGSTKNLNLYLALLAIPCFLILLIVAVAIYLGCKSRKKKDIDGKFHMSQIHSTASDGNDQRRSEENRNTISSNGSDQKYPAPYADDNDDEDEENYNYKKIGNGRTTNGSHMMF